MNRNRLRLFKYLVERFANESNIQVFLDRRMKERREPGADSSSDRRRRERRKATPDEVELQAFGFTIVKVNFKVEPES